MITTPAISTDARSHSIWLDNWRGWAILFVLAGHFVEPRGANFGRLGVELFFVLSGRLMADLLFVKRARLRQFYYRRFSRVFPGSLLFVATAWVIFPRGANELTTKAALASAAMVVNYTQLSGVGSLVTGHFWSLCIEEHSYVVLGLIAWVLRRDDRLGNRWSAGICLALAAAMVLNGWRLTAQSLDYYAVYWRSDVRGATIFMSAGIRMLYVDRPKATWCKPWLAVVAVIAGIALNTNHVPDTVKYSAGSLLIALAVNSLDFAYSTVRKFLSSRVIAWVGLVSYSVYIWQQPFYYSIEHYGALSMLIAALATGVAIFYLYEDPVRRWLNLSATDRFAQKSGKLTATAAR